MQPLSHSQPAVLRDEKLPRSFLVARQVDGFADMTEQSEGDIRFPDWRRIIEPLRGESEVVVQFDPTLVGMSALLNDARLMSCSYEATTHVVAIFRHDRRVHGQVAFRYYDNDSRERRRGKYELKSAMELWTRCAMTAITTADSALHRAVQAFSEQPRAVVDIPDSSDSDG